MSAKRLGLAALPFAVFLLLTAVSWQRWIEPYVDTGRELMVPWRMAHGEALYRDVRFYYGPLGPLLAAGVEGAAGRSLPARILLAAVVALAHIEALRRLALRFLSAGQAGLATGLAVAAVFFLRQGGCSLFPYSLDTSVAVAAATWGLVLFRSQVRWFLGVPVLAALLARPETGLALAGVLVLAELLSGNPAPRRRPVAWMVPALAVGAAVYVWFSLGTPLATLRREGWLAFVSVPDEFRNVYSSFSGLDQPSLRLAELALVGIVLALGAAALVLIALAASRAGDARRARLVQIAGAVGLAAIGLVWLRPPEWLVATRDLFPPLIRPVPVFVALAAIARLLLRMRKAEDRGPFRSVPDEALLLATYFSIRLILAAGYGGPYAGFYLPLAILVATAGAFGLAERAARFRGCEALPGLLAASAAIFLSGRVLALADAYRRPGWSRISTAAGALVLPEPYATTTRLALADLARRLPPGGSAVGFPEIGFLQYALGLRNPLPQDQFFPGHLDQRALEDAIRRIELRPPDAFIYVNVLTVGQRAAAFGTDYLRPLDQAVRSLSVPVASYGPGASFQSRIGDPQFFVTIRVPAARVSPPR